MTTSQRLKAVRYHALGALLLLVFANHASAFCEPGDVQACIVNGQPGEQFCGDDGRFGPCFAIVEPAPPIPAAPAVIGRGADGRSLSVSWTDSNMWATAVYSLQHQSGFNWVTIATLANPQVDFEHTGLQPDSRNCYRVEVTSGTHTRASDPSCAYTTDGTKRGVSRLQIELRTADVADAGTDDSIRVVLGEWPGPTSATWINYGRDDFERRDTFTYDLNLEAIQLLSDVTQIKVVKYGTNGWCLAGFRLLVNDVPVYATDPLPGGCRWLDDDDGHQPSYTVGHGALRAHSLWQNYQPLSRFTLDVSAFPVIKATLPIARTELESRLEASIGHGLFNQALHWDNLPGGGGWVEAQAGSSAEILAVDLDLEASVSYWFDPAVDLDFDLRFEAGCSADGKRAVAQVTSENLHVSTNFSAFTHFLANTLFVGCDLVGCVTLFEQYITERIERGFKDVGTDLSQNLPSTVTCQSGSVAVLPDGNVDITFFLRANQ